LGRVLKKTAEVAQFWGAIFSHKKMYYFCQKVGLATFWAIFLQTHLVTLIEST
jgi:hypothetical protein